MREGDSSLTFESDWLLFLCELWLEGEGTEDERGRALVITPDLSRVISFLLLNSSSLHA